MAFGLGVLRLSPEAFWSLSIPELKAAIRGLRGGTDRIDPLPRDILAALMTRFPDHPGEAPQDTPEGRHADGR